MKNWLTEKRCKDQYETYKGILDTLGTNATKELKNDVKFWKEAWKRREKQRTEKAKTRYIIIYQNYERLTSENRIEIIGATPIQALRKQFPDKIIETTGNYAGNTQIITAAVTYVNGVPHYGYNCSYKRYNYNIREKSLFEKLAEIHSKKICRSK